MQKRKNPKKTIVQVSEVHGIMHFKIKLIKINTKVEENEN